MKAVTLLDSRETFLSCLYIQGEHGLYAFVTVRPSADLAFGYT